MFPGKSPQLTDAPSWQNNNNTIFSDNDTPSDGHVAVTHAVREHVIARSRITVLIFT